MATTAVFNYSSLNSVSFPGAKLETKSPKLCLLQPYRKKICPLGLMNRKAGPISTPKTISERFSLLRTKKENDNVPSLVQTLNVEKFFATKIEFEKPQRIGFYSSEISLKDKSAKYKSDRSELRWCIYFNEKKLDLDLWTGYNYKFDWNTSENTSQLFFKWINEKVYQQKSISLQNVDFLTTRGCLVKVMLSLHDKITWSLMATKVNNTIILTGFGSGSGHEKDSIEYHNILCYTGKRFEEFATRPNKSNINLYDGEFGAFNVVLKSKIGKHCLVYTAEMDASDNKADRSKSLDQINFVELKTCGLLENNSGWDYFERNKSCKWWCQAHVGGIEKIVCGFRDKLLMVKKVETIKCSELLASQKNWKSQECVDFLNNFLDFVKFNCNQQFKTIVFSYNPKTEDVKLSESKLPNHLPTWFLKNAVTAKV